MSTTIMSKSFNSKSTTSEQIMKLIEIIRSKYGYGFTLSGMFFFEKWFYFSLINLTYICYESRLTGFSVLFYVLLWKRIISLLKFSHLIDGKKWKIAYIRISSSYSRNFIIQVLRLILKNFSGRCSQSRSLK